MGDSPGFNNKLDDSAAVELTGKIMVAAIIILFLVVVFVLLLHLYAKWFWWRIEDSTNPSREARSSRRRRHGFVFTPGQDPAVSALRRGLDPSVLRSLPVVVFRPEEFKEGLECAVCLSELGAGEKARMLPKCDHGFHVDCIDMWFQSHSTCPLCRNPVAPDSSNAASSIELPETNQSAENQNTSGYSTDSSPNFPTNVLFWGNQTRVSAGVLSLEEGPSSQPPASSSSSSSSTGSSRPDGMLVIDIPRQLTDNFPSSSPSASRFAEEEAKSPMPTRLRSLKRLLSREKRTVVPSSPTSVDVEQGGVGRG